MRGATFRRGVPVWSVATVATVSLMMLACNGDNPEADDLDFAYVSANPPSPELISIQAGTLDQQDWVVAQPPRPDRANITPHFSPDGNWIAFEQRVPDLGEEVGRIHIVDIHDGRQIEVTGQLGHDERCQLLPRGWSPDGEDVAFVCHPVGDDGASRQVGFVNTDADATLLEPGDGIDAFSDIRFDSDGDLLVVADETDATRSLRRLDTDDLDDGAGEVISEFDDDRFIADLQMSPDGDELAMTRATDSDGWTARPEASVIVVDLQSGDRRTLLGGDDSGHHSVQHWHPDGDRLLVASGGYGADTGALRVVDADDGRDVATLVEAQDLEHGTIRRAEVSPDGDTVIFSDNDSEDGDPMRWSRGTIHVVDIDGGGLQRFDELSVPDETNQPTFRPTGR